MTPSRTLRITTTLFFLPALLSAAETIVARDPVEPASGKDAWRVISGKWTGKGNRFVETTQGGLAPTAGKGFWSGGNAGATAENRGIARYFDGKTFAPGTYTVSFDIGCFDDMPLTGNFVISLIADTDGDGAYHWNERLPSSEINIITDTKPAPGKWLRWTCTFDIFPASKNVSGHSLPGAPLGFMILSRVSAGSGYAFDNLTITHTPRK